MTILDNESVRVALQQAGRAHGIVDDPDVWRLADLSTVALAADGSVTGVVEAVAKLKEAKPYLAPRKSAKDLSPEDRIAALKDIIRRSERPRSASSPGTSSTTKPPAPGTSQGKTAKDMTPAEQAAKLAEIRRKFA